MSQGHAMDETAAAAEVATLTYTAAFRFEEGWWWAQAVEVPEVFGQGRTVEEARGSVAEAVQAALRSRRRGQPITAFPARSPLAR